LKGGDGELYCTGGGFLAENELFAMATDSHLENKFKKI